ncbi:MAG: TrkH family potassium uptake protein [Bradymonadia bacterium]
MQLLHLGHLVGVLLLILAGAMVPSWVIAALDNGPDLAGLSSAVQWTTVVGLVLFLGTRRQARQRSLSHRAGFLIVGVAWLVAGLVGALPFFLYAHLSPEGICEAAAQVAALGEGRLPIGGEFCSFTDAAFESISGFTTTGSSILTDGLWDGPGTMMAGDRPGLPRGVLLWRSMTHFLGGMGIVVLGVAILPLLGVGGMELFKAEVPGPTTDKLAPRVGETAKLLWKVYLLFSGIMFSLLMIGGIDAFSAVNHTMATMATGGFSLYSGSAASFQSPYVEWVLILFMYMAGINFNLHFVALRGRPLAPLKDPEWRVYTFICVAFTLIIALALTSGADQAPEGHAHGFGTNVRIAAFQVLATITTTGFASADFEAWTFAPAALGFLMLLFFFGGMAGSTGGGVKVVRHILLVKQWVRELFLLIHPRGVRPVRLAGRPVPPAVMRGVFSFIGAYIALLAIGTLCFALDGQDMATAFTASASALGNVGPGLGDIGPYDNWSVLGDAAKWIAGLLMLLGRLEIYTLLILLSPQFWRR